MIPNLLSIRKLLLDYLKFKKTVLLSNKLCVFEDLFSLPCENTYKTISNVVPELVTNGAINKYIDRWINDEEEVIYWDSAKKPNGRTERVPAFLHIRHHDEFVKIQNNPRKDVLLF